MSKPEISVDTRAFDSMLRVASEAQAPVQAEIFVNNEEVQAYWPILEFGGKASGPWKKPGLKTTTGPGGRIYSKQAPRGFIFRFRDKFLQFLRNAYEKRFAVKKLPLSKAELEAATFEAAQKATDLIREQVPRDSGKLLRAIRWREVKE